MMNYEQNIENIKKVPYAKKWFWFDFIWFLQPLHSTTELKRFIWPCYWDVHFWLSQEADYNTRSLGRRGKVDKRNNQDKTSTYCTLRLVGQSSSSFRLKQKARSNQIHYGQNRRIGQTDTLTHHIVPKETKNNTIDRHRLSGSKRLLYFGRYWSMLGWSWKPALSPSIFIQSERC